MADFNDILGHDSIKEHLKNAITMDKVNHAYIFNGEKGCGKSLMAKAFAKTLQCSEGGAEPCNKCHSCVQAESNNQPDIIYVTHEKPASIGVDDVRTQLVDDISIKPYSSKYKIYIIDEAEKLTVQAQNAILKTIEEPPAYGIIIFLTDNSEKFLQTILSRCVILNFKPVENERIIEYVVKRCKIPRYQAQLCAAFAQGQPGKAIRLAENPDFEETKNGIIKLVSNIHKTDIAELAAFIKELGKSKTEQKSDSDNEQAGFSMIDTCLDIMTMWYRDVLLFKASNDPNKLIFTDSVAEIRSCAARSSYEGIEVILESIEKARIRLRANVNFDMTMELLLLAMKEN